MKLAYVFWHRPRDGIDPADYEASLRAFHATLELPSASFRLASLPFGAGGGYEDWYLVDGWAQLGELNVDAVAAVRRTVHDAAAHASAEGWGGVYGLARGVAEPPVAARWVTKPAGRSYEEFLSSLEAPSVWLRQMVLGPAPEFCLVDGEQTGRVRVYY